ncbi:hypothetical protein [Anaerostipes caccae]|nr:hypothetical protein [Anaerostipes caccae]
MTEEEYKEYLEYLEKLDQEIKKLPGKFLITDRAIIALFII